MITLCFRDIQYQLLLVRCMTVIIFVFLNPFIDDVWGQTDAPRSCHLDVPSPCPRLIRIVKTRITIKLLTTTSCDDEIQKMRDSRKHTYSTSNYHHLSRPNLNLWVSGSRDSIALLIHAVTCWSLKSQCQVRSSYRTSTIPYIVVNNYYYLDIFFLLFSIYENKLG